MRIFALLPVFCCLLLAACGGSETATLDADKADSKQVAEQQDQIEIPIGTAASRVVQLLGPADSTENLADGRQLWRYSQKRAAFVYTSNSGNVYTLIIGKYIREPGAKSPGLPLMLTLVFDSARKVADFNFAQLTF